MLRVVLKTLLFTISVYGKNKKRAERIKNDVTRSISFSLDKWKLSIVEIVDLEFTSDIQNYLHNA